MVHLSTFIVRVLKVILCKVLGGYFDLVGAVVSALRGGGKLLGTNPRVPSVAADFTPTPATKTCRRGPRSRGYFRFSLTGEFGDWLALKGNRKLQIQNSPIHKCELWSSLGSWVTNLVLATTVQTRMKSPGRVSPPPCYPTLATKTRTWRGWGTRSECAVNGLAAGGDHLGGVLEAGFGDFGAGDHSGDFVGAGAVVEDADLGFGAAVGFALFDD